MTNGRFVVIASAVAWLGCMSHGHVATTETITIAGPGFAPDPLTSTAQAGGRDDASAIAATDGAGHACIGSIPSIPQHVLHLGAALPLLRVLVSGVDDTTLVVRAPNGTVYCNDDSGDPNQSLNPLVEITGAVPGDYAIYVGAYRQQAMLTTYSIGFTATPGTFPSEVVR